MDLKKIIFEVFPIIKKYKIKEDLNSIIVSSKYSTMSIDIDHREERLNIYLFKTGLKDDFINIEVIYDDLKIFPFVFEGISEFQFENYLKYYQYVCSFIFEKWFIGVYEKWDYYKELMNQIRGNLNIYKLPSTKTIHLNNDFDKSIKLSDEDYLKSVFTKEYLKYGWDIIYYNYGLYERIYSIKHGESGFLLEFRNRVLSNIIDVYLVNEYENYDRLDLNIILSNTTEIVPHRMNSLKLIDNERLKFDMFLKETNFELLKSPEKIYKSAKDRQSKLYNDLI